MRRSSVRRKLFAAIFGPTFGILVAFAVIGLWLDVIALRRSIERDARIEAQVLATALVGPLSSMDEPWVHDVLSALKADPDIAFAAVYSEDHRVFSSSILHAGAGIPAAPSEGRGKTILSVVQPIKMGEQTIGSLLLGVSLKRYHERLNWYILGALLSTLVLSLIAAIAASVLQRQVSEPLRVLADTAESISQERDYSVRAPELRDVEFQSLTTAFNHMLGEIQGQTSALTDANKQLTSANAELEAFTYSVSHDLRTPLRAISGYAQLAQSIGEGQIPAEAAEYLTRIEANAIRMGELIDDLLAFSRVDARPLAREKVKLNRMVDEIWSELRAQNPQRDLVLSTDDLGTVEADSSLIRQVFTNLLHNAVKYSRDRRPATIHVGLTTQDNKRVYFVRDNGAGFDMQYASKLFGLFQRLHNQKDFEGTGIGLAIVQRIVLRHGGKVWAAGEPGKGATFFFTLS